MRFVCESIFISATLQRFSFLWQTAKLGHKPKMRSRNAGVERFSTHTQTHTHAIKGLYHKPFISLSSKYTYVCTYQHIDPVSQRNLKH